MRFVIFVGALAMVVSLGGCFSPEFVDNCISALRGQMKSPDAMTVLNSKWAKTGREVKIFINYAAADDEGRIGRYNANCIFNGEDIVGLFTKSS